MHTEPETGKGSPLPGDQPGTGCVDSLPLGKEACQAQSPCCVAEQGVKDCMREIAFPSTNRGLCHTSVVVCQGAPGWLGQILWGCGEGSNTFTPKLFKDGKECKCIYLIFFLFFFSFFFSFFFRAAPAAPAPGGSQAKGPIGATAAGLRQSHKTRSEPCL